MLQRMLNEAVVALTQEATSASAWRRMVTPRDVVGIKSNVWRSLPTPPELEEAIRQEAVAAGVAAANVAVDDRGILDNPVFQRATALVNTRPMRTHDWSGLGTCRKNYIMFARRPSAYHGDACASLGAVWRLPHVAGKTRLNVLVMLTPQFHGVGPHSYSPQYVWPYYGLAVGFDPVAVGELPGVAPHPNADRLPVCEVSPGGDARHPIVCGAKNMKENVFGIDISAGLTTANQAKIQAIIHSPGETIPNFTGVLNKVGDLYDELNKLHPKYKTFFENIFNVTLDDGITTVAEYNSMTEIVTADHPYAWGTYTYPGAVQFTRALIKNADLVNGLKDAAQPVRATFKQGYGIDVDLPLTIDGCEALSNTTGDPKYTTAADFIEKLDNVQNAVSGSSRSTPKVCCQR